MYVHVNFGGAFPISDWSQSRWPTNFLDGVDVFTPLKELEQFLVHLDTVMEDKEKEQQTSSVNTNIAVDGVQTRNLLPLIIQHLKFSIDPFSY